MLSDFHIHTQFSGDSDAPVRDMIEKAILLGMKELCITDHHDYGVDSGDIDFHLDFDSYWETLPALREEYKNKITLRIGIEMGLLPGLGPYCREIAGRYPFDFIIGSTHFVDGMDPYYPAFFHGRDEGAAYEQYFHTLLENVKSCGDFDVCGHIDYIIRYGPHKGQFYTYDSYSRYLEPLLSILAENGKGIECNTCGLRYGLGQPNPHPDILRRFRELGGEIVTVGSDAHDAKYLGSEFSRAEEILKSCGYRYYATYSQRKPVFHKL